MNNVLEYKGYYTKIEFDTEDKILYGKIEMIRDLVNFESSSVEGIEEEFHQAVDDYLLYCEEKGIEPDKTFSGKFNVRISPELHRKAVLEATKQDVSLNNIVQKALKELLTKEKYKVNEKIVILPVQKKIEIEYDDNYDMSALFYKNGGRKLRSEKEIYRYECNN